MLRRGDFTDHWRDLTRFDVKLPDAPGECETTCPIRMEKILEYLDYEAPGGRYAGHQKVRPFELNWLRAVLVNADRFWMWSFRDADNRDSFVFVRQTEKGQRQLAYDESL